MKKVAILQSNYIPWKGYFDLIAAVDEFIIFDDMQYTRRDWRNRNKIKTPRGLQWLSVPVSVKGKYLQKIKDTEIAEKDWGLKHWNLLLYNYKQAPHFDAMAEWIKPLYKESEYSNLSQLNVSFIQEICNFLNIETTLSKSWDYKVVDGKTERLIDLCKKAGGSEYISGPAAKAYIDKALFDQEGIKLSWFDYGDYPTYTQMWGGFIHEVTIFDLLFNCGNDSAKYMRFVDK